MRAPMHRRLALLGAQAHPLVPAEAIREPREPGMPPAHFGLGVLGNSCGRASTQNCQLERCAQSVSVRSGRELGRMTRLLGNSLHSVSGAPRISGGIVRALVELASRSSRNLNIRQALRAPTLGLRIGVQLRPWARSADREGGIVILARRTHGFELCQLSCPGYHECIVGIARCGVAGCCPLVLATCSSELGLRGIRPPGPSMTNPPLHVPMRVWYRGAGWLNTLVGAASWLTWNAEATPTSPPMGSPRFVVL